jgi:hypothetical protein
LGALLLGNSGLYRLFQKSPESPKSKQGENPFGQFIDEGYPAVCWVAVNMALGVKKINGTIIPPKGSFSLLSTLMTGEKPDINNRDPKKGFVLGLQPKIGNPRYIAGGICKLATDVFRCALSSPIVIKERHMHPGISPDSPYFRNYPFGTDASLYFDDRNPQDESKQWDLKLENPWPFPVKIDYQLFDVRGRLVNSDDIINNPGDNLEHALGLWAKVLSGIGKTGKLMEGVVPNGVAVRPLTSRVCFVPLTDDIKDVNLRDWLIKMDAPSRNGDNWVLDRQLYIGGQLVDSYHQEDKLN